MSENEVKDIYEKYVNMVYRICFMYLKNESETEDATQNVFLKFIKANKKYNSDEHIKASLIVTAQNECKNLLRHWWKKNRVSIDNVGEVEYIENYDVNTLSIEVMRLPDKYKLPIYLYYYEGYSTKEIAKLLKVNHSTIRTRLVCGRDKLKAILEVMDNEHRAVK